MKEKTLRRRSRTNATAGKQLNKLDKIERMNKKAGRVRKEQKDRPNPKSIIPKSTGHKSPRPNRHSQKAK